MKVLKLRKASIASLFELIESQPLSTHYLFRGQRDASWGLVPGLYRTKPNIHSTSIEDQFDLYENMCLERFFNEGLPYLPPIPRGYSNDRILAQHFGVPTRLLDWTADPLVATYFAVEKWNTETDAALFMIVPDATYRREDVKGLGSHQAIAFRPPAIDRRIPAQKSMFTFHPYGAPDAPFVPLDERPEMGNLVSSGERGFAKIIIPKSRKRHVFQALIAMGVDRRNLFPGLDGVGFDVAARAASGQLG
jgi:hypothetical protein